jgi:hypothetical protein
VQSINTPEGQLRTQRSSRRIPRMLVDRRNIIPRDYRCSVSDSSFRRAVYGQPYRTGRAEKQWCSEKNIVGVKAGVPKVTVKFWS